VLLFGCPTKIFKITFGVGLAQIGVRLLGTDKTHFQVSNRSLISLISATIL
jgi:hypothetical protein